MWRLVTSQWIDPGYECLVQDDGWEVSGVLQAVPSNKLFTPMRNLFFRGVLVLLGWSPTLCHQLKGQIRKALILGQRPVPVRFARRLRIDGARLTLCDEIQVEGGVEVVALSVGETVFTRYVPQSRYFQTQEFGVSGLKLDPEICVRLLGDFLKRALEMRPCHNWLAAFMSQVVLVIKDHPDVSDSPDELRIEYRNATAFGDRQSIAVHHDIAVSVYLEEAWESQAGMVVLSPDCKPPNIIDGAIQALRRTNSLICLSCLKV